jgi:hypothetical protein
MGVVYVEGKNVTLDDEIINAGIETIKAALSVDFPDVENADIQIERPATAGAPTRATVVKRGTGLGQDDEPQLSHAHADVLRVLMGAPEYVNPAIALSVRVMRAETAGDTEFLDRAIRSGEVERAVAAGEREGHAVQKALAACGRGVPVASKSVPVGF